MEEKPDEFEGWALCELLGHRRLYGYVKPTTLAGAGILRIDLADHEGGFKGTQFVPPSSLYAITPMTEEAVREMVKPPRPLTVYALPSATVAEDPFSEADAPEEEECEPPPSWRW